MADLATIWNDRTTPVILRSTTTSPFGRKVRMAALALGLDDKIIRQDANTLDVKDDLRQQNPLGKIPCLLIGNEAFYDSAVLIEMLDVLAGGGIILPPAGTVERFTTLTRARLADGIADAALLIVYEGRFREPSQRSDRWVAHQQGKILRALSVFETSPPDTDRVDAVGIGLAAALGYLDWRQPLDWRSHHPCLVAWLEAFSANTPIFAATESDIS